VRPPLRPRPARTTAVVFLLLLGAGLVPGSAFTAPVEGVEYFRLAKPVADTNPDRISVLVFFRYACTVCATVAPALDAYAGQRPADVDVVYVPVLANERDVGPARLYYTLQAMGLAERLQSRVYRDVLDGQPRLDLNDTAAVLAWAGRQPEVNAAGFAKAYESFGVNTRLQGALAENARHPGGNLPNVFVDGRYRLEPGSWYPLLTDGPDYPRFLALMTAVVALARTPAR
jgi:thiol:disulfide interchange protein DsbA